IITRTPPRPTLFPYTTLFRSQFARPTPCTLLLFLLQLQSPPSDSYRYHTLTRVRANLSHVPSHLHLCPWQFLPRLDRLAQRFLYGPRRLPELSARRNPASNHLPQQTLEQKSARAV